MKRGKFEGTDAEAAAFFARRLDGLVGTVRAVLCDYFYALRRLRLEHAICGPLGMAGLAEDFLRLVESDRPATAFSDALAKTAAPPPRKGAPQKPRETSLIPPI